MVIFRYLRERRDARVAAAERNRLAASLVQMLGEGAWCVDSVEEKDGMIEVIGWAVAPGHRPDALDFTLNDRHFDKVLYPTVRPDLERVLWYVPEAAICGFECYTPGRLADFCTDGVATLKFVHKQSGQPITERHNYYFNLDTGRELPPAHLRTRVHGAPSEIAFRLEGYTNFTKLQLALQRIFGRSYRDFPRILDWGVGCGRFSRYFEKVGNLSVTGADIDREAVEWVSDHLDVEGIVLPLHPPSPLAESGYDLIIGISIFTHLAEQEQFEWLNELRRIAAPGAVVLMSVHGDTAVSRQTWSFEKLQTWRETGLHVGASYDLVDVLSAEDADYYKTTCHTRAYIETHWSKYFEIVEIIPGYVGNLQDLVVMVKR